MSQDVYLNSKQVTTRYGGISEMTLWRWVNQDRSSFPKPIYINRRRLWPLHAIEAWERSSACQKASA